MPAVLTAGMLVFSLTPVASAETTRPPVVAVAPAAAVATPGVAASHTVTLVTGDRITVTSEGNLAVDSSRIRDGVTFLTYEAGGHQYVIPSDALGLVRDGRLDRRLFDVNLLQEFGYDDRRGDLPLIITGRGAPATLVDAAGQVDLPVVGGVAASVDKAELGVFWDGLTDPVGESATRSLAAGVSTVWLDGLRRPLLDESVPQVGAPVAHAAGLDGTGVTVAVLDTGIDLTHPDLAEQVVASANFTDGQEDDRDLMGHGTHVASILGGTGATSGGQFRGVAPGASLLNGKVCRQDGRCADSSILAGMQWAAEQGADVVNMSLGDFDEPGLDPVEQAVETLTAEFGTLFVIAAGNDGGFAPVSSPASAPAAVAVGAVDKADQLADFSSQGPSVDDALKPDLTAPGVEITAANSSDGELGEPGQPYTTIDGTSMATPHVAGAAAILVQQHPEWTPRQLKAALMGSAEPHPELGPYAQGSGRLDVARAVTQAVIADPPTAGFDRRPWPHDDDEPQTRTVTYFNGGDVEVNLELALTAAGPDGVPAPDGLFTLAATSVTVPAGGSAGVTLTANTSVGEVDGLFSGYLTAAGPDTVVTTPFAVDREVESYDLTLNHIGRDGLPTSNYSTALFPLDTVDAIDVFSSEASPTVRVPAGEYALLGSVRADEAEEVTLLAHPRFVVDRDQTIAVDAREGRPISVTVPEPTAAPTDVLFGVRVPTGFGRGVIGESFEGVFSGRLGPDQTVDGFRSMVFSRWARPDTEGGFAGSPYTYHLSWLEPGRMLTGFTRDVKPRDLATVRAAYAAHVPGVAGQSSSTPSHPGRVEPLTSSTFIPEPPSRLTEYYNTDRGIRWIRTFEELDSNFDAVTSAVAPLTEYQAGRTYHEQWNQGVFGPVVPEELTAVSRLGDQLRIEPVLYGDSTGRPVATPAEGTITVYRDGARIAELPELSGTVDVPPGAADYRVAVAVVRDERFPLSTSTNLAWTFRSGHVDGDTPVPLPVSVVRFTPRLDQYNTAPPGRPYSIPVEVSAQPGSGAAGMRQLTVEVSFDDGASWHRAPLIAGRALVHHPARDGFVSLRASASDRGGNTVEQTVIRAYAIG